MANSLIAFYSRADENYMSGELKMLDIGNTEVAAGMIKELTGADLFKIDQLRPYSKSYNACITEAQLDQRRNARPELKAYPDGIDGYDVIYLGFPNYWGTMPMAVFTFLERFDFSGKLIKPFCTHEGSGMGTSEKDIQRICPGAKVERGLAIRGSSIQKAKNDMKRWVIK